MSGKVTKIADVLEERAKRAAERIADALINASPEEQEALLAALFRQHILEQSEATSSPSEAHGHPHTDEAAP